MECYIYFDGASRGNPGHAAIGISIQDSEKNILQNYSQYIGLATNNVAEYTAAITALELAGKHNVKKLHLYSDSELLVKQVKKEYKVKHPSIIPLYEKLTGLLKNYNFKIEHVRREKNSIADGLANEALDEKLKVE